MLVRTQCNQLHKLPLLKLPVPCKLAAMHSATSSLPSLLHPWQADVPRHQLLDSSAEQAHTSVHDLLRC